MHERFDKCLSSSSELRGFFNMGFSTCLSGSHEFILSESIAQLCNGPLRHSKVFRIAFPMWLHSRRSYRLRNIKAEVLLTTWTMPRSVEVLVIWL